MNIGQAILSIPMRGKVRSLSISVWRNIHTKSPHFNIYGSQSNTENAASPCILAVDFHRHKLNTKHKADDRFQCGCCKKLVCVCVKFLHSVLAVAAIAVSFGTCASLWYGAKSKKEKQLLPKKAEALHISD